jgi:hypothetical protein
MATLKSSTNTSLLATYHKATHRQVQCLRPG